MQNAPRPFCKLKVYEFPIYRSASNLTVGGDAHIAPRANVGIGPYGLYRRCTTNRNLNIKRNPAFAVAKAGNLYWENYCKLMAYWMELTLPSSRMMVRVPTRSAMI